MKRKYIISGYNKQKTKLNKCFAKLRKLGYFAKQNYYCCSGCGWSAIDNDKREKVVFYHRQDYDYMLETGKVYLAWSGNGEEIKKVFIDAGFKVEWSGDKGKRILIDFELSE